MIKYKNSVIIKMNKKRFLWGLQIIKYIIIRIDKTIIII